MGETIMRILYAEDEILFHTLFRCYLNKIADDIKADFVDDGEKAVTAFKSNEYDVIFMDIKMPNMNGIEAATKIKTINSNQIIIGTSAYERGIYEEGGCFDEYMRKPYNTDNIKEQLKKFVEI
jgi:CheY-like chemotaxis protein